MIISSSHAAVAADVVAVLAASGLTVVPPPTATYPVAGPCVVVGSPEATEPHDVRGDHWRFRVEVLVVGSSTAGADLFTLTDTVVGVAVAAGYRVTSRPRAYQPPSAPAPIPSYELTLE